MSMIAINVCVDVDQRKGCRVSGKKLTYINRGTEGGGWKQEVGCWMLDVGRWKVEMPSPPLGVGGPGPSPPLGAGGPAKEKGCLLRDSLFRGKKNV